LGAVRVGLRPGIGASAIGLVVPIGLRGST
jgi:hypothetical protein